MFCKVRVSVSEQYCTFIQSFQKSAEHVRRPPTMILVKGRFGWRRSKQQSQEKEEKKPLKVSEFFFLF